MAFPKYQTKEVLNKVLNSGETALQVDIVAGAEYAEDSEHTSTDTGNFVLGVRNDTLAELGGTDGDYVPFQMNADGALYVEISSGGANDSIYVDDADWTDSTSKHTLVGGLYQSSPQTITDGDVGPFQVDADGALHISDGGNAITVDGTVTANLGTTDNAVLDAIAASLAVLDDWDDSNYANVNANIAGTDIVGGAGAVASGVQRVTLASDDPAVTSLGNLDNAVDGNYLNVNMNLAGSDAQAGEGTISATTQRVTIATDDDGVAHLATIAGDTTSVDGKITACNTGAVVLAASDGTDIGDVDVASVPAPLNVVGGGTEAAALRVTMANNSTGVVSVDDGGGALTVDGTVTANLSATDNAVLDTIDAVLDTIKTDTGTIDSDTDAIKTATESSNTHLGNMFYDTALSVTPSDGSDLTGEPFYAVYVGTGGDLKVDMSDGGSAVTLSNVASGQLLPIMVERIYSTGTTASNIIAFK